MPTNHADAAPPDDRRRRVPAWFERVARLSWGFLGMVLAAVAVVLALAALRELVVPLVMAAFFAAVVAPGVDWLARHRVPRSIGAVLLIILIAVVISGALTIVVLSIYDQADELGERIDEAQAEIARLIEQSDVNDVIERVRDSADDGGSVLRDGLGTAIGSLLGSATGFVSGLVLGIVLLYYLLKDGGELIASFLRSRRPGNAAQYERIVHQAAASVRGYFRGKSLLALVQGVFVTVVLAIIGVPLPASIGVVNFIGAYIPFLGAFIGGAFAMLMALSEGGLGLALVTLGVVVFMNVVLENLLEPKLLGASLDMHPIVVLLSTVGGGVIAGFVGLILGAPLTAIGINLFGELQASGFFTGEPEGDDPARPGEREPGGDAESGGHDRTDDA